jgi:IclR family transcriptional regulator, pca regulon regulatory protein
VTAALDPTAAPAQAEHYVQSLERGLAVIRAFTAEAPELRLAEVARRTGLSRAAARRFLLTLVDLQYVRLDAGSYSLTPRVLELGYAYVASLSLPEVAEPHLERLASELGEFPALSVLDGHDIVCVARVPVSRLMTIAINVGTRLPAYATATGRVLLAALSEEELERYLEEAELRPLAVRTITDPEALRADVERVRAHGYSIVDQELERGLRSVAAPIRGRRGQVVAAVNLAVHESRRTLKSLREELLPPLLSAVARVEADLHAASTRDPPGCDMPR